MNRFSMVESSHFGQPRTFYYMTYPTGKTQLLGWKDWSYRWYWADNIYTGQGLIGTEIKPAEFVAVLTGSSPAEGRVGSSQPDRVSYDGRTTIPHQMTADELTGGIC